MASTVSAFSSLNSISIRPNLRCRHSLSLPITNVCFQPNSIATHFKQLTLTTHRNCREIVKPRSVEEESVVLEEVEADPLIEAQQDPAVSVPVSPSDTLTMFFQADGTMNESDIPKVTKALEGTEGVTDLNVRVLEGIASVELSKQTTVQATGVASSLVEAIQGAGFKLQTLNLSFDDEEDILD